MGATTIELIGVAVQWFAALLLLVLFQHLTGLGTQRRVLGTWRGAWLALLLALTGFLAEPVLQMAGSSPPGLIAVFGGLVYAAGKFAFLALVLLGALQAAARIVSLRVEYAIVFIASAVGALVALQLGESVVMLVQVVATPFVMFAASLVVGRAAIGPRGVALRRMALALGTYGVLWASYLAVIFFRSHLGMFGDLLDRLARSAGYADALVASALGASIIFVLVQDSFLEVATARSQRVRDLAASEARLIGIIESAEEAIVTLEGTGRISLCNPAADRMFRLLPGETLGRTLGEFLPNSDIAALNERRHEGPATIQGQARRADGSEFLVEFSVGALPERPTPGSVVILRDLTATRALAQEREALERSIAESQKMTAIGHLVSGVAHELNNPLAVVLGQSEQLLEAPEGHDIRPALHLIHEQAHRARHIVRDLLASVRQRDEIREPADLTEVVLHIVAAHGSRVTGAGVTIDTMLDTGVGPVMIDRVGIEQVVVNLLINACDAAGAGGHIRLITRKWQGVAELLVEDSGSGVADHLVPRLFEPFFTTKPVGQGTGLGLPVSLGVVEQHGGTLRLENRPEPGVGARFVVTLPLDVRGTPAVTVTAAHRAALLPRPVRLEGGGNAEVMIIDDESGVRATLARIFQRGGWPVRQVASAEEGLAWLLTAADDELPALIICDLKMPGMDGRELHGLLHDRRPSVLSRLMFVTGDVMEPATAEFLAAAGRPVVEKPFTVAEIARVVEEVLGRS